VLQQRGEHLERLIAETNPDTALAELTGGQINLEAAEANQVGHCKTPARAAEERVPPVGLTVKWHGLAGLHGKEN